MNINDPNAAGVSGGQTSGGKNRRFVIRWPLVVYDSLILATVMGFLFILYTSDPVLSLTGVVCQYALCSVSLLVTRNVLKVYKLIWRYGGIQSYIRLITADGAGTVLYFFLEGVLPVEHTTFDRLLAICCMNLLGALVIRMCYRYAFKYANTATLWGRFLRLMLNIFTGDTVHCVSDDPEQPADEELRDAAVGIAIIGAGNIGVALAAELINTASPSYAPKCFVDVSREKVGREVLGIPVLSENDTVFEALESLQVQEVVFAIPHLPDEQRKRLYGLYLDKGFKIKKYDYPLMQSATTKRQLREFDIEELLFRKTIRINNDQTRAYYRDKVILITGGGGSIGSELCRQIAKMQPRQIILLDIYENGAYDVQQELRLAYGQRLDLRVEIASITQKRALERVFWAYRPDIVINAAAHKHVPLMEHNCIEAVDNNVFGTKNLLELCRQYETPRFMMVSTDKAVNPTNVMGATKRMCELMVQSAATGGKTVCSATRFGNVLGSAGSVIPLFKRQIANGGPVTLTDKRIIRYFMTIPEAAMLVLESGAMAKNGELFVLDMGQPILIAQLAAAMIKLSGAHGIEIVETGLRPGEKLYEELLVKTEELDKTENSLIFIERDTPLGQEEIDRRLDILQRACEANDDDAVRQALHRVVPTYKTPEEVNARAERAREMREAKTPAVL